MGQPCYRCSGCNIDWPNAYSYSACPKCGEKTWSCGSGDPLDVLPAMSMAERFRQERTDGRIIAERKKQAHEDFEKWLAERDAAATAEFAAMMNELVGPMDPVGLDEAA